jgi:competence protein ComEA
MRKTLRVIAASLVLAVAVFASSGIALAADAAKAAPAGKVNLNTATVEQLASLPGVGASLASRIVEYRTKSGGFKNANELMNVKGIGEKNFGKLEPLVTTGDGPKSASR